MTNETTTKKVTIKKETEAGFFQDSSSWRGIPARYNIYNGDEKVGMIHGTARTYMGGSSTWEVYQTDVTGQMRPIQSFWPGRNSITPFARARAFTMQHDWNTPQPEVK